MVHARPDCGEGCEYGSKSCTTCPVRYIISVDPGKRTGIAILKFGGELVDKRIVPFEDISDHWGHLGGIQPTGILHAVVCETFQLYAHKSSAQHGSSMETSQVMGMARGFAALRNVKFVKQQPSCRMFGAKFIQYKLGKSHTPDDISAWLHGVYYLKMINQLTTALEMEMRRGN